ncbi:MAG: T9SS type A sorting domain-containing protein [Bacteroidales bacterium]|nr:T9SS type A sorting domain-containing protein [Bacteroidales bacterium]
MGNAPGSSEDGTISNTYSVSPSNSMNVVTNNDVVLQFGDLSTGRYRIDFDYLVQSGKNGYFNMLYAFNGSSSEWAYEVFFYQPSTGYLSVNGDDYEFSYTTNTWMHFRIFIDLDNDMASLFKDDVEIASWQWTGNLDATNFFGWAEDGMTCGYFVDNVELYSLPDVTAPSGLVATIDGTSTGIDLTWTAPTNTPDSYALFRNGKLYLTGVDATTFSDANIYPNNYTYNVAAFYNDLGYTPFSNTTDQITIGTFVDRDLVLFEIGTGTNCPYCPGASMGTDDLLDNGYDVAIVKYNTYSTSDPYYNGVGLDRADRYNLMYYPSTVVDGDLRMEGGSATVSLYPNYQVFFDDRATIPSLYTLDVSVTNDGSNNYTASIDIEEISDYYAGSVRLYVALTESHVQYNWGNQTEVNHRCIGMYPDEFGTDLTFTAKSISEDIDFTFDFNDDLITSDYELVVFIQEDNTNDVVQAIKTTIPALIPEVTITPADGTTNVGVDSDIEFHFNTQMRMIDDSEITNDNISDFISVTDPSKGEITYTATIDATKRNIIITPDADFTSLTDITVTLSGTEIENFDDVAFVDSDITFTTENSININGIENSNISVYPNPAINIIEVKANEGSVVEIMELSGKTLQSHILNSDIETINVENLNSGVYLIRISNGNEIYNQKLIIK